MELVQVEKRVLRFPAVPSEAQTPISDTLIVSNAASTDLAFKVKTTNQARYVVRPNVGIIPHGGNISIFVALQPSNEVPTVGPSKDKFLLMVAEAPDIAESGLQPDYWTERENDSDVVGIKFKVEFVDEGDVVDEAPVADNRARDMPEEVTPPGNVVTSAVVKDEAKPTNGHEAAVTDADANTTMSTSNYEAALERVRELQAMLDGKNLELARLKTELAETKAESERILKEAPKVPLAANQMLTDPFGGVSMVSYGLLFLLFVVIVGVLFRIS